ncbi:MAG: hypothetical protein ACM3ZF_04320 [Mycobacterium leprae]
MQFLWALVWFSGWIAVDLILALIIGRAARLGEPSYEATTKQQVIGLESLPLTVDQTPSHTNRRADQDADALANSA